MPKLTYPCPICQRPLVLLDEYKVSDNLLYRYKCGHLFSSRIDMQQTAALDFTSTDGSKHARNYQETGVEFIVQSRYNCIIADQMRLGKTPQSLLALKNALDKDKGRTPCLIIVKSANLWQWTREFKTWVTTLPNGIFPIVSGSKSWIPPGFSAYIISMDTFSRAAVLAKLKEIPFKLIIVDEAHSFKNSDSNRSQALVEFVKFMNTGEESLELTFNCSRCNHEWQETGKRKFDKRHAIQVTSKSSYCPQCRNYCYVQQQHDETDPLHQSPNPKVRKLLALAADQQGTPEGELALDRARALAPGSTVPDPDRQPCGLILLTGTPILNRADEYFVPLNLVAPEKFSSLEGFRRAWLQQNSKGQWAHVNPYRLDAFRAAIKPYVLRREKEDVYTDLPPINRIFTLIQPDKDQLSAQYNKILDQMETKLADKANPTYWDMADDLMELRRICGMMKIMWTADFLEVCLMDSPTEKYAVGIHHKSVRDILAMKLGEANCMKLSGEDSADRKDWIQEHFATAAERVLIINMLAGGVGMDFHYVNNVIILERQWNSPTEDQFEFRFYNPDRSIKNTSTNIEYVLAKGTIDEWWYDMVEGKRRVFGETVANNWTLDTDQGSFRELMEQTLAGRL